MSLQARLDALTADFGAGKPPHSVPRSVVDTMRRAMDELIASGAAGRALKAGDTAPSLVLLQRLALAARIQGRNEVVSQTAISNSPVMNVA